MHGETLKHVGFIYKIVQFLLSLCVLEAEQDDTP